MRVSTNLVLFLLLFLFLHLESRSAQGQDRRQITLTGTVVQAEGDSTLFGVNVVATSLADTTRRYGASTQRTGTFLVVVPTRGSYRVRFTHVGFKGFERNVAVTETNYDFGVVRLEKSVFKLDEVVVEAMRDRVVVKGDTTEYLADAFKVNPDATAEDLVAKMPGIQVEDGEVKAQGETVRRVTVDGREFFGDDPNLALRTLPSEIIERIQVFDRLSDQAQFTGFDDGNREMTMNIVTRLGRNRGQFGKVYGGYGSDDRYVTGGNINIFDDDRRISIIGLSNNVNQQNFTIEDLLGVVGNSGRRSGVGGGFRAGRGRGGGGADRRGGGGIRDAIVGRMTGGGRIRTNPSNFLVGSQAGVNTTHAAGLNYTDNLGEKIAVSGSYFFNMSDNTSDILLDREYFLTDESSQFYNESNSARSDNFNHRLTMRMTYTIDDANSIIFTPRISAQRNESESYLFGINSLEDLSRLSRTTNNYLSDNKGYTGSGNLLFRHRFSKSGRTISVNVGAGLNDRSGSSDQYSSNDFMDGRGLSEIIDQRTGNDQNGVNLSTNIAYTEPIGSVGQLQINYRPAWSQSDSDRLANTLDEITSEYSLLDPRLSSSFRYETLTHRGGISLRRRGEKSMLMVGVNLENELLTGDQSFPTEFGIDKSFRNVLPNALLQYNFSRSHNLRFFYRTSARTPSITQLQDVVDNSNPLQLSSGNPDLRRSYTHTFILRYSRTAPLKGRVVMANISLSRTSNNIGSETILAEEQMTLAGGVVLAPGSQFSRPVNIDGAWNLRSFFTLGMPTPALKSNLNMNAGYTFSRTPGLINRVENISNVHNMNAGFVLGSNISERVDFTVSYSMNGSIVKNSVYSETDGNYFYHRSSVKLNLLPWNRVVFQTSVNYLEYFGLGDDFDSSSLLWNAGIGYKFLKGNGGEIKLMVADLLNQNNALVRTVNEFYIEDNQSNTLGRYLILNFTYTLRNFRI